jgi:cell division protein FtsA
MKGKSANFIAIDIGSSKVAAIAANINKYGQAFIASQNLRSSNGFKAGVITDLKSAEESFVSVIYSLENDIDKSVNEVSVAVSGAGIKSFYVNYSIKLSGNGVTKQDIRKLIQKALAEFKVPEMEIIHYFPIEFVLDGDNIVENPMGMYGSELSCQLHIIAANSAKILNLTKCLSRCQVEVREVISAVYASGLSTLTEDEKKLGAIIVDIGSHTSSFAVFLEDKCVFTGYVPIGGYQITSDIAKVFSVSMVTAEKLKILYGYADPNLLQREETIRIENFEDSSAYGADLSITSSQLARVINNRTQEIFLQIKEQYDYLQMDNLLARRMVITGGSANLHGIKNLVSKVFHKQVRIAKPHLIDGFVESYNSSAYTAALGLIINESKKIAKDSPIAMINDDNGWLKKTFSWIKENI